MAMASPSSTSKAPAPSGRILPPPFINLPNLPNLRDAGGLPILSTVPESKPRRVRKHILYRSADPSRISTSELQTLHHDLGINTIFDLRSEPEIEKVGTLSAWEATLAAYNESLPQNHQGISRKWVPVFRKEDYSPESIASRFKSYGSADGVEGFVEAYRQILTNAGPTLNVILTHMARGPSDGEATKVGGEKEGAGGGGVLIHCTAGKDRAGSTIAMILSLLGVSAHDVSVEYNLTETGLAEVRPQFVERLMASGAFVDGEEGLRAANRMVGARKEAMEATLKMVVEKWGSIEGYIREVVGVGDEVLKGVRRNLICLYDEIETTHNEAKHKQRLSTL